MRSPVSLPVAMASTVSGVQLVGFIWEMELKKSARLGMSAKVPVVTA